MPDPVVPPHRAVSVGEPLLEAATQAIRRARTNLPASPVTVVVPTPYAAYFLRHEFTRRCGGLFNVSFLRVEDLVDRLAPSGGQRARLSRLRAAELVRTVAVRAELPSRLRAAQRHPAFHSALHRALDALAGLAPLTFRRLAVEPDDVQNALAGLLRAYQVAAGPYEDRRSVAARAAATVRADPAVLRKRFGHVILLLVEDPAPQYAPFVETLLAQPGVEGIAAFTGEPRADARVAALVPGARPEAAGGLLQTPGETHLVSTPDRAEEVRWVVRNVVRLARGRVRLGEIAVLYEDSSYGVRIEEALRLAKIPVSGPDPKPLAIHPEGRFVLGFLRVFREDFARAAVAGWLTGSPVRDPAGQPVRGARWDAVSRNAGVTSGFESWIARLQRYEERLRKSLAAENAEVSELSEAETNARRSEANAVRAARGFLEDLAQHEPPQDGATWAEFATWLRGVVDAFLVKNESDEGAEYRRERLNGLLDELAGLDEVQGEQPDLDRFAETVGEALSVPLRRSRTLGRGVFVAHLRDAVGSRFRVAHFLGMAEGHYPTRPVEDVLLPDVVRASLDPTHLLLPRRTEQAASARRRYLTALATAGHRVLLWPRYESGATRSSGPSQWFLETARLLAGDMSLLASDLYTHEGRSWLTFVPSPDAALREDAVADLADYDLLSVRRWTESGRRLEDHFLADDPERGLRAGLNSLRARASADWTGWDGNLHTVFDPRSHSLRAVSPTRLQTWAGCPYRYFLEHELHLAAVEEPEELLGISPLDRGSLVHVILERFVKERNRLQLQDSNREEILFRSTAENAFQAAESEGITGKSVLWRVEREAILRELNRFLVDEHREIENSGRAPREAELRFGYPDSAIPEVMLEISAGRVSFRGVIDRVEVGRDGSVSVVDYKTGGTDSYRGMKDDPLDRGKLLQLPVYALAVRSGFRPTGPVEAAYWFVSERGGFERRPVRFDQALEDRTRAVVNTIASGIWGGTFPARPGGTGFASGRPQTAQHENCAHCPFDTVCPAGRVQIWERKRGAPELVAYRALAEGDEEAS